VGVEERLERAPDEERRKVECGGLFRGIDDRSHAVRS
jgi:hypothetical protein